MKNLSELAKNFKTDKGVGGHDYTEIYDIYFDPIKDDKITFFEIGIFKGESLKMWEAYFKNATIIGLDINPDCAQYAGDRRKVYIGSQTDEYLLWKIEKENHPISVIIDDGTHKRDHQANTFNADFPLLKPGGLYFIEDLHTSYAGGEWRTSDTTGVEFTQHLVDDVMLHGKSFMGYQELVGKNLTYNERNIEYVHFYRSQCVIKKREQPL